MENTWTILSEASAPHWHYYAYHVISVKFRLSSVYVTVTLQKCCSEGPMTLSLFHKVSTRCKHKVFFTVVEKYLTEEALHLTEFLLVHIFQGRKEVS